MKHLRPVLAAVLAVPALAVAAQAATQFRDIPANHWARRPAGVLADAGIMPGRSLVDFAGEQPLTRYELARVLSELYVVKGPPTTFILLSDMPPGHYATLEVQRVIGFGLLAAKKPGKFQGDALVSRKELVEAFDTLFTKSGIRAASRRPYAIAFSDVPPGSPLDQVLDRIVNRYGLMDAKRGEAFKPYNPITRYQVLSMLTRAIVYFNPALAAELKEPPSPAPSLSPGASAPPSPAPTATTAATPAPGQSPGATPAPAVEPAFPAQPILRNWLYAHYELVGSFSEALPTDPGSTVASEQKEFEGGLLSGGAVGAELWTGRTGYGLRAGTTYLPVDVPIAGKVQPNNILDSVVQLTGTYKLAGGADWEFALGGGAHVRYTRNLDTEGNTYLTTDKLYLGAGPAFAYGMRLSDNFTLTSTLLAFPLMQSYHIASGDVSLTRLGLDGTVRGEYWLNPGLFLTGGTHVQAVFGGGGRQTAIGLTVGVGTTY